MSTLVASNLQASGGGGVAATLASVNGGPLAGARNRIINGDMRIDQRNNGASVSGVSNNYVIDRWKVDQVDAWTTLSLGRNLNSVTPPTGFTNYLGVQSNAASTPSSTQVSFTTQVIEAFNMSDLAYGTAAAATVKLSFWVRSSLTGSFGLSIAGVPASGASVRSYPTSYTINAANTWEYKTITIPGDTDTGSVWPTGNTAGLFVRFMIGAGSTWFATANQWATGNFGSPSGVVNVAGTNGATLYITGVQLETGSIATPFERRSYTQELQLCQRYAVVFRGAAGTFDYPIIGSGTCASATDSYIVIPTPVSMRATPTPSFSGTITVLDGVSSRTLSSVPTQYMTSPNATWIQATHASGLTAGRGVIMYAANATTNTFTLAAEL